LLTAIEVYGTLGVIDIDHGPPNIFIAPTDR
jgi:hypothetical protein